MHWIVCSGLFSYLTTGLDSACQIFEEGLGKFFVGDLAHEDLLISYSQMVFKHSSQHPIPPSIARSLLYRGMELYPTNELFLVMFIEGEAQSQIANRLRTYFDEACHK